MNEYVSNSKWTDREKRFRGNPFVLTHPGNLPEGRGIREFTPCLTLSKECEGQEGSRGGGCVQRLL
ncbi:hypothetical protein TNCT_332701, partial [Trichonephila clavata]